MLCLLNVGLLGNRFITGEYENTDHRHVFCSSWSRRISEKSRKAFFIACSKTVF